MVLNWINHFASKIEMFILSITLILNIAYRFGALMYAKLGGQFLTTICQMKQSLRFLGGADLKRKRVRVKLYQVVSVNNGANG